MPGSTPNRGYPYPVNTDALNVAVDIESLARAIDIDFANISAPEALSIRPWTADAAWGSLAHPSMLATEAILISRPAQPTIVTSWVGQPVQLRYSATDASHMLQVGLDHRFTGGHVYQMTGGSGFLVPQNTDSLFGDHTVSCFYRPRDSANNTHFFNTTGGHIYHNAWAHHFRHLDGSHDTMVVAPASDEVFITGNLRMNGNGAITWPAHGNPGLQATGAGWVRTTPGIGLAAARGDFHSTAADGQWTSQQLIVQASAGQAGIGFAVHQNGWAVILRANPASGLAPCLDVALSDSSNYANMAALTFNTMSSARFKEDIRPLDDAELLGRAMQVEAVSWALPGRDPRYLGVTAEALSVPFPEMVSLDADGEPATVDTSQLASTALALAGALARKLTLMEARLDAAAI